MGAVNTPRGDDAGVEVDLDAIEARANAATPGPWRTSVHVPHAVFVGAPGEGFGHVMAAGPSSVGTPTDSAFVAHARTDVPALVAALRAARPRVAALEAERIGTDVIALLARAFANRPQGDDFCHERVIVSTPHYRRIRDELARFRSTPTTAPTDAR